MTRTRYIETIDTREQHHDGTKWRPVPGSGETLACHCCGRMHEVHVLVAIEDRDEARDKPMAKAWKQIAVRNYGVSCARKITTVEPGSVARQFNQGRYDKMIALARLAA